MCADHLERALEEEISCFAERQTYETIKVIQRGKVTEQRLGAGR